MDITLVPPPIRWMIPIVEIFNNDADCTQLDSSLRGQMMELFTIPVRAALEEWLESGTSLERSQFYFAMVKLDELGLIEHTEPTLDFNFWVNAMSGPSWGNRRNAAKQLGEEFIDQLDNMAKELLLGRVAVLLDSERHPNAKVWFAWLKCKLDPTAVDAAEFIRSTAIRSLEGPYEDKDDLPVDAWVALLELPKISSSDVTSAEQFIFSKRTDEYDAAVVLETLLSSESVPLAERFRLRDEALIVPSEALREVAEECEL